MSSASEVVYYGPAAGIPGEYAPGEFGFVPDETSRNMLDVAFRVTWSHPHAWEWLSQTIAVQAYPNQRSFIEQAKEIIHLFYENCRPKGMQTFLDMSFVVNNIQYIAHRGWWVQEWLLQREEWRQDFETAWGCLVHLWTTPSTLPHGRTLYFSRV